MAQVEERLNIVESALAEFIIQSNRSLRKLESEIQLLKQELNNPEAKKDLSADKPEWDDSWVIFLNGIGDFCKDILFPEVPKIIASYFEEEVVDWYFQRKKFQNGHLAFSVGPVAATKNSVFIFKADRNTNRESIIEFKQDIINKFFEFFPEYVDLKLIPIFATTEVKEGLIRLASEEGIYFLVFRNWTKMDILNFEAVRSSTPPQAPLS